MQIIDPRDEEKGMGGRKADAACILLRPVLNEDVCLLDP
jgi:hypothetical protein